MIELQVIFCQNQYIFVTNWGCTKARWQLTSSITTFLAQHYILTKFSGPALKFLVYFKKKKRSKNSWKWCGWLRIFVTNSGCTNYYPKYNDLFCQIYKNCPEIQNTSFESCNSINLAKSVVICWVNWWQNMLIWKRITCNNNKLPWTTG